MAASGPLEFIHWLAENQHLSNSKKSIYTKKKLYVDLLAVRGICVGTLTSTLQSSSTGGAGGSEEDSGCSL